MDASNIQVGRIVAATTKSKLSASNVAVAMRAQVRANAAASQRPTLQISQSPQQLVPGPNMPFGGAMPGGSFPLEGLQLGVGVFAHPGEGGKVDKGPCDPAHIMALIELLGHEEYDRRQEAAEELKFWFPLCPELFFEMLRRVRGAGGTEALTDDAEILARLRELLLGWLGDLFSELGKLLGTDIDTFDLRARLAQLARKLVHAGGAVGDAAAAALEALEHCVDLKPDDCKKKLKQALIELLGAIIDEIRS